jgi:hypothetical protein
MASWLAGEKTGREAKRAVCTTGCVEVLHDRNGAFLRVKHIPNRYMAASWQISEKAI